MSNAAVSVGVQALVWRHGFHSLGCTPGMELLHDYFSGLVSHATPSHPLCSSRSGHGGALPAGPNSYFQALTRLPTLLFPREALSSYHFGSKSCVLLTPISTVTFSAPSSHAASCWESQAALPARLLTPGFGLQYSLPTSPYLPRLYSSPHLDSAV